MLEKDWISVCKFAFVEAMVSFVLPSCESVGDYKECSGDHGKEKGKNH